MLKNILAIGLTMVAIACNNSVSKQTTRSPAMNTLTNKEKKDGWELMFDGVSTRGWHKYGNKPVGKAWKVADGMLFLDTADKKNWQKDDAGDIVSDSEYDNFHLKYDWRVAVNGNSGVIFYAQEDSKYTWPWETGPEMQVLDNNGHPDAKIIKHRAGDLYDLVSSSKETVKPAMEWNTAEIKSLNGKLDLYLNGENIVSTMLWDENWKNLVAGSKFKSSSDFGKYQKGKIGLQDHGDNVWFRNIKIRRL
ncbi:MAG: 3-keto-disaccharide hydrolase [Chitinophagaceae bacterium]